jgi:hypothetical protein
MIDQQPIPVQPQPQARSCARCSAPIIAGRKFCSRSCYAIFRWGDKSGDLPSDPEPPCLVCGQAVSFFIPGHCYLRRKDMRFCSVRCRHERARSETICRERFWERVNKDGPEHLTLGKCWVWTGYRIEEGYGQLTVNNRPCPAHRYSYELHFGKPPDSLCVCHHCDNPPCVNPAHLFLGTNQDNVDDKVAKGRCLVGERHGRAKLSDDQVREMRRRYRPRSKTDGALAMAKEFGVSEPTVRQIIARRIWTHI